MCYNEGMAKLIEKRYIGDAVYVDYDGYHIVLTTSDGLRNTNTIYLEPGVWNQLSDWTKELKHEQQGESK